MYNATTDKNILDNSISKLNEIYNSIPDTKGCLEWIKKEEKDGGCGAWCCSKQYPQVLYIEFKNIWNFVINNWGKERFLALIESSLMAYLIDEHRMACVFWNKNDKTCQCHQYRPFNCRVYGILPEEEFKPRYEKLKILYPNTRDQCNLISTVNGEKVTKDQVDLWWKQICEVETSIGIHPGFIHDELGGSYRTFYEHVLLETMGEQGMEMLSKMRIEYSNEEKLESIKMCISSLSKTISQRF